MSQGIEEASVVVTPPVATSADNPPTPDEVQPILPDVMEPGESPPAVSEPAAIVDVGAEEQPASETQSTESRPTGPETGGHRGGHERHSPDLSRIAQDLQIRRVQVESVVEMLDAGCTVPFITRYRRELTTGLGEEMIRNIQMRIRNIRQLANKKQTILKSIESRGKLTPELREAIIEADSPKRLEDLHLPHKHKKPTAATVARDRGLEAFAQAVWDRDPAVANLNEMVTSLINPEKQLNTPEEVLQGTQHILAERIAEDAEVRAAVRFVLWETGKLKTSKKENLPPHLGIDYKDYFQFTESIRHIPPHRILAINRGEKEHVLQVRLEWDDDFLQRVLFAGAHHKPPVLAWADHPHAELLKATAADALKNLLLPNLEREIRRELTMRAEDHAIDVFARNLQGMLLGRPLRNSRVLAIDPGYRTGCKVAVLDEAGNLLEEAIIFPHQPPKKVHGKKESPAPPVPAAPTESPAPPAATEPSEATATAAPVEVSAAPAAPLEPPAADTVQTETIPSATDTAPSDTTSAAIAATPSEPAQPPAAEKKESAPAARSHKWEDAKARLANLLCKHQVHVVAIGNGTACRETEELVSELFEELESGTRKQGSGVRGQRSGVRGQGSGVRSQESVASSQESGATDTAAALVCQVSVVSASWPTADTHHSPLTTHDSAADTHHSPLTTHDSAADTHHYSVPADLCYAIINEAGANEYAVGPVGRDEFPNCDAALRGTISIGRRLLDPLSEWVKVDPDNIGVGLYQHDVNPKYLKECLDAVIQSCVNHVGVDVNTASVALLQHISGLNETTARAIVEHRKQHGPFRCREQLLQVTGMSPHRYEQAVGFLVVNGGDNPLDTTCIHPESYAVAAQVLADLGLGAEVLQHTDRLEELHGKLREVSAKDLSGRLQLSVPAVYDLLDDLAQPGRDPRDHHPPPIFRRRMLRLEDLHPGMELKGTVLNVVDFGAFIDVGLKDSGLVHISQMSTHFIKNPYELVAVGQAVTVWVLTVDHDRRRVSLTMVAPGTPREPAEKKHQPSRREGGEREERGGRPPRGRRPAPHRPQPAGQQAQTGEPPAPQEGTAPASDRRGPPPRHRGRQGGRQGDRRHQRPPAQEVVQRPPPRPARPRPKPKLTQAALEGASPLRTFSELAAFIEAKEKKDVPPPAAEPAPPEQQPPSS